MTATRGMAKISLPPASSFQVFIVLIADDASAAPRFRRFFIKRSQKLLLIFQFFGCSYDDLPSAGA